MSLLSQVGYVSSARAATAAASPNAPSVIATGVSATGDNTSYQVFRGGQLEFSWPEDLAAPFASSMSCASGAVNVNNQCATGCSSGVPFTQAPSTVDWRQQPSSSSLVPAFAARLSPGARVLVARSQPSFNAFTANFR